MKQRQSPRETAIFFKGHKHPLSNMFPTPIHIWGILFPSSEHAYQFFKSKHVGDISLARRIRYSRTPYEAMHLSKTLKLDKKWHNMKINIMYEILQAKAVQCKAFWQCLQASTDKTIVEDTLNEFWGRGKNGNGSNMLGFLLMKVRKSSGVITPTSSSNKSQHIHTNSDLSVPSLKIATRVSPDCNMSQHACAQATSSNHVQATLTNHVQGNSTYQSGATLSNHVPAISTNHIKPHSQPLYKTDSQFISTFSTMASSLQTAETVKFCSTRTMEIGMKRSTVVEANDKGITFFSGEGKTFKIRISPSAVHVMNSFLGAIHDAVELLKSGNLTQKYSLPLGARIFLEIDPNYRCVSLRKFFRPKANPSIILPGLQGIGLKLEEFSQLELNWHHLLESVPWEEAHCCYFNHPTEHFDCDYCWR